MDGTSAAVLLLVKGTLALLGCGSNDDATPAYDWQLPPGLPAPLVPEDNPMSAAKVELGRRLFYDRRLSGNATQSCGSCHQPSLAFGDGKATPVGSTGDVVSRNSPSIVNAAYFTSLTWMNPKLTSLEAQVLVPLFADAPKELAAAAHLPKLLERLRTDAVYAPLFTAAFADEATRYSTTSVTRALACFVRSLISANTPYDRYTYGGDDDAISESAKRGLALFNSDKAECYHCHGGPNFSVSFRSADTADAPAAFFNTGLYNVGGRGSYPAPNVGIQELTGRSQDNGKFRPPSLRNVALTAPYMHDGSVATLEEVVELYNQGGRNVTEGPNAGDGRLHPHKDPLVHPLRLSEQDKADLVAFLRSLTDEPLSTNPRFADPWRE
jgi:cytochrome c peroxidase